jgi:hypothetical protein
VEHSGKMKLQPDHPELEEKLLPVDPQIATKH